VSELYLWILRRRCHVVSPRRQEHGVLWPAVGGDGESLLIGFLGEVEVAEEADPAGEDASPLVAEDLLEDG